MYDMVCSCIQSISLQFTVDLNTQCHDQDTQSQTKDKMLKTDRHVNQNKGVHLWRTAYTISSYREKFSSNSYSKVGWLIKWLHVVIMPWWTTNAASWSVYLNKCLFVKTPMFCFCMTVFIRVLRRLSSDQAGCFTWWHYGRQGKWCIALSDTW